MQLQLINEIEELSFAKQDEYEQILHKWQLQDIANFSDFQYIEPILTQRTIMFQINNILIDNINIKNALFNTYLQISKIAADKEDLQIATRALGIYNKKCYIIKLIINYNILFLFCFFILYFFYKYYKFFYESYFDKTKRYTTKNSRSITLSRISISPT